MWPLGVEVKTLHSDSSDRVSNLREAFFGMLFETHLLAHCVHCPCCRTVMTLRGAKAITHTASFFNAMKHSEHRNKMEHESKQRENRMHSLLIWGRCVR